MKKIFATLILCLPILLFAQTTTTVAPSILSVITFNEGTTANSIITDKEGNCFIVGAFFGEVKFGDFTLKSKIDYLNDLFVAKINSAGKILWAKSAGSEEEDKATSIVMDSNGNIYISGIINGDADFGEIKIKHLPQQPPAIDRHYTENGFIAKLDSKGNFIWVKSFRDKKNLIDPLLAMDENNNCFLGINFSESLFFNEQKFTVGTDKAGVVIAKYTPDGKAVWTKLFAEGEFVTVDEICLDKNNELYLSGFSNYPSRIGNTSYKETDENNLKSDKFIAKMNTTGNFLWVKTSNTLIKTSTYGNLITSNIKDGIYTSSIYSNNSDIVVSMLAANGNILWSKKIGQANGDKGNIINMTSDKLGNIYIIGWFYDIITIGNKVLTKKDAWNENLFVVKLNPSGTVIWSKNFDSKGVESFTKGSAITIDKLGNIWLLGHIMGETTIGKTKINANFQRGASFLIKMK
ncbi:MAG: hypothetical protein LC134_00045 [Chitinophagales bacterium]|nr:hypothetical protein [Chitinophagales bacterium]